MGSEFSVLAEEESAETERVSEEQNKTEKEPNQEAKHKVLFLTEDEAKQPSTVNLSV